LSTTGLDAQECRLCGDQPRPWECLSDGLCPGCWRQEHRDRLRADGGVVNGAHANSGQPGLRYGYWMQFWAAIYALTTVYPQPGLTALATALLVVLAALIYLTRPQAWGGRP